MPSRVLQYSVGRYTVPTEVSLHLEPFEGDVQRGLLTIVSDQNTDLGPEPLEITPAWHNATHQELTLKLAPNGIKTFVD